ncbi:MAG TPA: hypothetical protein VHG91_08775, partial [Longimicrobium sp.]|nr:hypothetical protein [Longimicrobium sp.]
MEILEIFIGLSLVYLLLSLLCTAINEYIATMLDKRGKELVRGIDQLLGEHDEALKAAFYRHPLISSLYPDRDRVLDWEEKLKAWGGRWRPLRPFYRLARFIADREVRNRRRPSYIPARNFALALLDVTDYTRSEGLRQPRGPAQPAQPGPPNPPAPAAGPVPTPDGLKQAFEALRNTSGADVSELLLSPEVGALLSSYAVPADVRQKLVGAVSGVENELQKLHDSVEVWFNNTMDRVSGTYKRYTQIALVVIGFVVAFLANADTIQIWRTLAVNDEVRQAMVLRAEATARGMSAA